LFHKNQVKLVWQPKDFSGERQFAATPACLGGHALRLIDPRSCHCERSCIL